VPLTKPERIRRKLGISKTIDRGCPTERLADLAERARYTGSPYHQPPGSKIGSSSRPVGRDYPAASKCDSKWTKEEANRALKDAIRTSSVSPDARSGVPKYVWYLDGATLYEARLTNETLGEYHAYPLNDAREWPRGFT
jgi:hypothetical protein